MRELEEEKIKVSRDFNIVAEHRLLMVEPMGALIPKK